MKTLITFLAFIFLGGAIRAQENIGSFIFPKGILSADYVYMGTGGNDVKEMKSRIQYIQNGDRVRFQKIELFDGEVNSTLKRNFIITDSVIYLQSQTGSLGNNNIYAKLPTELKSVKWETNEGGTIYKCEAKKEKLKYDGEIVNSIIIERTPFENNKSLNEFKTKMIFIYGVGLYKEIMFKTNKSLYRLDTLERL